jgi:hypothetical protein
MLIYIGYIITYSPFLFTEIIGICLFFSKKSKTSFSLLVKILYSIIVFCYHFQFLYTFTNIIPYRKNMYWYKIFAKMFCVGAKYIKFFHWFIHYRNAAYGNTFSMNIKFHFRVSKNRLIINPMHWG